MLNTQQAGTAFIIIKEPIIKGEGKGKKAQDLEKP